MEQTRDPSMTAPAHEEATLLLALSREVTSTLDLQEVLDKTFAALRRLIPFGGGAIQLVEDGALLAVATDPPMSADARSVRIPLGEGISGRIAVTGEPAYLPDIWSDARVTTSGGPRTAVSSGVRSYFGVPLIMHGETVGVLQIDSPDVDAFPADARTRVMAFIPTVAAAVQNAQIFSREMETIEHLRETQQMKRDFLAVVSHELRTPLTSIAGFGYTLAEHAGRLDAETVADIGQRIWRAGRRLERVMGDLLDLSMIERGTLVTEVIPTPLEPIVRAAVDEQLVGAHPIEVSIAPDLPPVLANPHRLHQVVGNLLSNARKFSPAGSPIEVAVAPEGPRVAVTITDHGRGIDPAIIDRVYERFYQGEPAQTRSADGLGIGLYLVKHFCDRMGAEVSVRSAQGTTVRVALRCA